MDPEVRRLKAIVDSDPAGLVRILHFFQARNITPVRVMAERLDPELIEVQIDVLAVDISTDTMHLVIAKVRELLAAHGAVWSEPETERCHIPLE